VRLLLIYVTHSASTKLLDCLVNIQYSELVRTQQPELQMSPCDF